MPLPLEHKFIKTNGVKLHVVQAGPEDGQLVILLHGFPEFWYGWRKQIEPLAEAGYRVCVPDQRGYNLSDKPLWLMSYSRDELAKDVIGLIDAAGREKAVVIGHDWGAAVAWWLANVYPQRLEKLVILNVPHHEIMVKNLLINPAQMLKSWYIGAFQMPLLPEAISTFNNFEAVTKAMQETARPGTFTEADMEQYRKAWSQPGALTAMINYYRAAPWAINPDNPRIHMPTRIIWGKKDAFLGAEMAQPSADLCDDAELYFIDEATHWVQHEEPERVNQLILEFLAHGNRP
jgi:epoxide hydrolase 4